MGQWFQGLPQPEPEKLSCPTTHKKTLCTWSIKQERTETKETASSFRFLPWKEYLQTWLNVKTGLTSAKTGLLLVALLLLSVLSPTEAVFIPNVLHCPNQCNCTGTATVSQLVGAGAGLRVDCSAQGLDQVPIHLFHSGIETVDHANWTHQDLTGFIQHLDLSYNRLESFQVSPTTPDDGLTKDSSANVTSSDAFLSPRVLTTVVELNLSHNFISNITFIDLSVCKGTTSLDLSYNIITQLNALSHVDQLVTLDLSHNSIETISPDAFHSLVHLTTLDLSHNKLYGGSELNTILQSLSSLRQLYLNGNRLTQVAIPALARLMTLDIANNQIESIVPFGQMQSLVSLNMSDNKIELLQDDTLKHLDHLEELYLDHNPMSSLDAPFSTLTSLHTLSLSHLTTMTSVSHDTFHGLTNLVKLNLSYCPILNFFPPNALMTSPKLQSVDLSHSGLQLISPITFQGLGLLKEIRLVGNPFRCDCTNGWLQQESRSNSSLIKDTSSLKCETEAGNSVIISEAEFGCDNITIHNKSTVFSITLGNYLTLNCPHDSATDNVVTWITPKGRQLTYHPIHPSASQHLLSPSDVEIDAGYHSKHYWHDSTSYHSELESAPERIILLSDGSLYIDYMLRSDTGTYECRVSNLQYSDSLKVTLYLNSHINTVVKPYAYVAGLLCALSFFTLNLIYVIITWIARRLVNKRRREAIRQMLETLNVYKSSQMTRIHENYTHQLSRVRNQYHVQRDKLHKNYTHQVDRMKRGCSNGVERVRDNYHNRLTQLREYSSNQVVQIRERANNQIVRIRDYGSLQLDRLRETYKLQQQHVLKLLDTMNLDNCRHVVETECMRTESMMFDIDLLGDMDDRTDSPLSVIESEYKTASSSPSDDHTILSQSFEQTENAENKYNEDVLIEMKTNLELDNGMEVKSSRMWVYDESCENNERDVSYFLNISSLDLEEEYLEQDNDEDLDQEDFDLGFNHDTEDGYSEHERYSRNMNAHVSKQAPLPEVNVKSPRRYRTKSHSVGEGSTDQDFVTPDSSPVRRTPLNTAEFRVAGDATKLYNGENDSDDAHCAVVMEEESPETVL